MKQITDNLNKIVTERMETGEKEYINYLQAEEALNIVKKLRIKSQYDVLLFCAVMNLLNTYVKQPDRKFGYSFKSYINHLFVALTRNDINGVKIGFDIEITKKEQAIAYVIVQIEDIQFSFHQIKVTSEALELKQNTDVVKELSFDGIRKQMCACTIFEKVKNI